MNASAPSAAQSPAPMAHAKLAAHLAAISEMVAGASAETTPEQACQRLADTLQTYLGCRQVVVALCERGTADCRVAALSGLNVFRADDEPVRRAQAVLLESLARGAGSQWPAAAGENAYALMAHRQLAEHHRDALVWSSPLRDARGELCGAWLVAGAAQHVPAAEVARFLSAAEIPVASTLGMQLRARRGWLARRWQVLVSQLRGRATRYVLVACLVALALSFWPLAYTLRCDCRLEPVTRRYVAAPFNVSLAKVMARPGDVVAENQVLAQLDGREVEWELAGTTADLHRATKEKAGYIASHESGKAEIASHELRRLEMKTKLLGTRQQQLAVRSPISGLLVSGNAKDAEGMPLAEGQVLFEVAPLDEMQVEVLIPEGEASLVQEGAPVFVRFSALPFERFEATLERIHPRAEMLPEGYAFIAEFRLPNPDQRLRPGMRGRATIMASPQPLIWQWLRRPAAAAWQWWGW